MKAVRIHRHGQPEDLVYEDVPKPQPAAGQVLVRNEAAGINFADIDQRRNKYPFQPPLPHILGSEFAGTVESVGEGVSDVEVGERVFGFLSGAEPAGYAQYVAVSANSVHPLPPGLGYAESTALLVQGLTAYFLLRDGVRLAAGDSVLIMAAAGGLGSMAVQLAKIMAAGRVIGAASTAEKRRRAIELGADESVDYTQPGWSAQVFDATGGRGVDAVLVNVGGESFTQSIASLAPFGRLSAYGGADETTPVLDFLAEFKAGRLTKNQTLNFFTLYPYLHAGPAVLRPVLDELADHVESGRLLVRLGVQMSLSQAAEAHRLVENRQSTGKAVLLPWAD
ncbi:Alcohol dehydrogenase zinc-binding domain protein [Segniliparus rotundus DSM 44985]|uniref:Alcohol dehydrogenase zinc-binding domain protein n=2 Tax=Segniliparus rotundus TaxID=286802 RepID=D6ZEH3_SEGRD|nr:Alcohol dehydrogenase zinc-binding domain protein [Segniliparus rotundus DSM 44985]